MPAAPQKKIVLDRPAPTLVVLVGAVDGSAPTAADEVDWLHPIRIERAIGGARVSAVTFHYDLGKTGERIVDTLTPKGITRQIEVRELDDKGDPTRLLIWGKLAAQPCEIDGETQTLGYVVRIDKHLLGKPLGKTPFWNPNTSAVLDVDRPLVFNPEIDDTVKANRSDKIDAARGSAYCLYDVAGPNTAAARTLHGQTFTKWRIFEAAHRLIWLLNPSETFVKNPTLAELQVALGNVDATVEKLKNFHAARGKYLSELLDELLVPFGCSWYVSLDIGANGNSDRRLKCFTRNEGSQQQLHLQRAPLPTTLNPVALDPTLSSLTKFGLKYDITNLANRIVGTSSRKKLEISALLCKGWPTSQDGMDRDVLNSDATARKNYPHAFRYWPLNEHGGHTGLRPEITAFTDLSTYFGTPTAPIARKLLECISRVQDANSDKLESRGIVLHWYDPNAATYPDPNGWKLVKSSFSRLEQEGGIWFETVPKDIHEAIQSATSPDDVKLRVTATIEGDQCLEAIATRRTSSPNADDVTLSIDLDDKFHSRDVHSSSIYIGDLTSADTAYDTAALQDYVDRIRDVEDAAELSCSCEIEGIDHPEYELSDLITRVNGVNITLIRDNPAIGVPGKSLQIVGIVLDVEKQRTELLLETFDLERLT